MKIHRIIIFLTFTLAFLFAKCECTSLPFLNQKYIYWLIAVIGGTVLFLYKESNTKLSLNIFDILMLILTCITFWNLIFLSKAAVFNLKLWYFFGYLLVYVILRRSLNTDEIIRKSQSFLHHFIAVTAIVNGSIAVLQENHLLLSKNEHFLSTALFYSPNQLGLFMALGCLSSIELIKKYKGYIKTLCILCFLISLYGLYLSKCRGACLGLGAALFYDFYKSKNSVRFIRWKIMVPLLLFLCGFFFLFFNTAALKSESTSGRVFITERVLEEVKDKLLTGHGFDSFALKYNTAKAQYFESERSWQEIKNASYIYNANNDFLELTFEFGLIWIFVFTLIIFMLFYFSIQTSEIKSCTTMLLCLIIFAFTNSVLSVPLFIVLGCCFSVIIINTIKNKPIYIFNNYKFTQILNITFAISFFAVLLFRINAEYKLLKLYEQKVSFTSFKTIENYISKIDANGEQFFMAGVILLKNKHTKEGTFYLEKGFECSGKPSLGKILAGIYEKQNQFSNAEKIYIYNINAEPFRFEPRVDLFQLYVRTNQKKKAIETAKKIIDLPIKIPSDKIGTFKKEARSYITKQQKAE
ncbi:O-antigen ligase family protein [Flavobacterium gelatinilyticum]|uniref:O-antigen ligase family protein n=1 Tax=Flavobacterium gelatinilyticum TaxID=3003260 RepID=UPI00247FB766|nr:O-antigen ligase family protein [Flavobacterium gelatinilyticum]